MFDKMKQLMEMKRQADQIKKQLDASDVEVNDVNGIRIVINGAQNFKSIEIDDSIISSGNKSKIESDILRSVNAAIKASQKLAAEKMRGVMPSIPGF